MEINTLLQTIAKTLMVLSIVYVVLKGWNKARSRQQPASFYEKNKILLYHVHINGGKFAIILGFVHGIFFESYDPVYSWTGWLLGLFMVATLGIGSYMSWRLRNVPMDEEKDVEWRTLRIIKWVAFVFAFVFLALHFLLEEWIT